MFKVSIEDTHIVEQHTVKHDLEYQGNLDQSAYTAYTNSLDNGFSPAPIDCPTAKTSSLHYNHHLTARLSFFMVSSWRLLLVNLRIC